MTTRTFDTVTPQEHEHAYRSVTTHAISGIAFPIDDFGFLVHIDKNWGSALYYWLGDH